MKYEAFVRESDFLGSWLTPIKPLPKVEPSNKADKVKSPKKKTK